jgi:putative transposase
MLDLENLLKALFHMRIYPCSLTADGILGQFSRTKDSAEKEYRQFVKRGDGKEAIGIEVKGQVILGEDDFVESLAGHLKKHKDLPGISKSQRYAARPSLDKIFKESILNDKRKRDGKIADAVEKYGCTQRSISDHPGLHFSYVSSILYGHYKRQTV